MSETKNYTIPADQELSEEMQEAIQDAPSGFVITNDVKAEWAIKKIAEIQAEADRMIDFHERQIEVTLAQADHRIGYLKEMLRRYTCQVPMKETKTQLKYSLPSGDLVLKKPAVIYKRDDDQLMQWLRESGNTDLIVSKQSPAWGELKKLITVVDDQVVLAETGEVVKGVETYLSDPDFVVKMKEG